MRGTGGGKNWSCSSGQSLAQNSFNSITCWWVGLCPLPGSCLAWPNPALGSVGSCSGYWWPSRAFTSRGTFRDCRCLFPASCRERLLTHACTGDPPTLAGRFASASCGSLLLFSGLGAHKILFVTFQTGVSVSPSPVEVLSSDPTGPQGQIPWGFPVPLLDPQVGSLTWGSEPSLQWENFFGLFFSSFWVAHPVRLGFDFIMVVPLLCLWTKKIVWSIFFWWIPGSFCWWLCNS